MKRFTTLLIAALASLGLMAGGALAQKAETPKDATKKTEAPKDAKAKAEPKKAEPKADAKKAEPKADAKKADSKKAESKKSDSAAAGGLIDINSASEKELASLPGIGEARAKAIVKNRPYKGKDDLKNRKIIPDSAYSQIQDKVIAKQK